MPEKQPSRIEATTQITERQAVNLVLGCAKHPGREVICYCLDTSTTDKYFKKSTYRPDLHQKHGIPSKSIIDTLIRSDIVVIRKKGE